MKWAGINSEGGGEIPKWLRGVRGQKRPGGKTARQSLGRKRNGRAGQRWAGQVQDLLPFRGGRVTMSLTALVGSCPDWSCSTTESRGTTSAGARRSARRMRLVAEARSCCCTAGWSRLRTSVAARAAAAPCSTHAVERGEGRSGRVAFGAGACGGVCGNAGFFS